MLLDQDGSFESAFGEFAVGILGILLLRSDATLFFDADEHLPKEKALELLPGLAVFTDSNGTM